jgi:DNA-binding XRE family transcriptional regulator
MHRRQFSGARNKLDLNNRVQVRIVRKRLNVSEEQLASLVGTTGNSIAAVTKEAGSKRRLSLPGSQLPLADTTH